MALNLVFANLREKKTKTDVVNKIKKSRPTYYQMFHGNTCLQLPCNLLMIRTLFFLFFLFSKIRLFLSCYSVMRQHKWTFTSFLFSMIRENQQIMWSVLLVLIRISTVCKNWHSLFILHCTKDAHLIHLSDHRMYRIPYTVWFILRYTFFSGFAIILNHE